MEITYKSLSGRLAIKVSGSTQKEVFKELAAAQDVFDAESRCRLCESPDLAFRVRTIDGNDFFELACRHCQAVFPFGQHKTGGSLFPKRDPGWHHWKKEGA
jgi:hypothetical protein